MWNKYVFLRLTPHFLSHVLPSFVLTKRSYKQNCSRDTGPRYRLKFASSLNFNFSSRGSEPRTIKRPQLRTATLYNSVGPLIPRFVVINPSRLQYTLSRVQVYYRTSFIRTRDTEFKTESQWNWTLEALFTSFSFFFSLSPRDCCEGSILDSNVSRSHPPPQREAGGERPAAKLSVFFLPGTWPRVSQLSVNNADD